VAPIILQKSGLPSYFSFFLSKLPKKSYSQVSVLTDYNLIQSLKSNAQNSACLQPSVKLNVSTTMKLPKVSVFRVQRGKKGQNGIFRLTRAIRKPKKEKCKSKTTAIARRVSRCENAL